MTQLQYSTRCFEFPMVGQGLAASCCFLRWTEQEHAELQCWQSPSRKLWDSCSWSDVFSKDFQLMPFATSELWKKCQQKVWRSCGFFTDGVLTDTLCHFALLILLSFLPRNDIFWMKRWRKKSIAATLQTLKSCRLVDSLFWSRVPWRKASQMITKLMSWWPR